MRKPLHPWGVLLLAVILPGVGHVVSRQPVRGLIFLFFILLLGAFTMKTAGPDVSVVGRYAGGLFVWAMSILDAYRIGRIRHEVWRHQA
jgi:hypothetical protein